MQTKHAESPEKSESLPPLNVIRVETVLSRYPVHRLAKQGTASIEIRDKSPDGEVLVHWEVSHNTRYGQPGPLAYKIDTLIVNRRIEEATRPIPKLIKLGSQAGIAEELGISTHNTITSIKRALYQNASAFITAKFYYKIANGTTKELEAGFTRYTVVFTGEKLPDGRRADSVYLVLNEVFMQVINGVQTRPLDYEYLKDLVPASQRLYELLSYQIYATLKNGRGDARLTYSEFCTYAPLTRFIKWDQVRPQMARIHRPHLQSAYIESVEFQQTADRDGKPDWLILYVPGDRARAEHRAFTNRGGPRVLEVERVAPPPAHAPQPKPSPLEQELVSRGVTLSTARDIVRDYPEERIAAQVEYFDWHSEKNPGKVQSPGGYLADAIRAGYVPPKGYETKANRTKREEAAASEKRRRHEELRKKRAEQHRVKHLDEEVRKAWAALSEGGKRRLEAQALSEASPEIRAQYEVSEGPARRLLMVGIRQGYLKGQVVAAEAREGVAPESPR